ncbi:MAG: hypothetical protein HN726_03980 [Candidatus Magasanikbacteria bacterium]|jgi:sugar-specific transcriptional regulator TrmB|nr:hypothetical protein [Candidatus Magasanikbacteria bacterium]MBT4350237.1 hypothetical protein [Candidatus Magasanikbacteria bacterium]MBT4541893.1 hypothetical protein [Candidatus Magasanikbacteria bacterium]MBT6252862.1 hypothetical protein [Candidatus Magasanikbacteria bacterium]MBT6334853.1 hypothetical protein [Candidatus Magasanikbacteria bacterium]
MEQELEQFGLDESEAKIYLALLHLGPSSVTEITNKADITRTLGYHVLEKLCTYGLVKNVSQGTKKKQYVAEHPSNVVRFVEERKENWERKLKEAEQRLPNLLSLYKIADKPVVQYQEGVEGIKTLYLQSLESTTEVISILDLDSFEIGEIKDFVSGCARIRKKKQIKERSLVLDTPIARERFKEMFHEEQFAQCRWIDPSKLPGIVGFGGMLSVFEDKAMVTIIPRPGQAGMVIESTILTTLLKGLFDLAWDVGRSIGVPPLHQV